MGKARLARAIIGDAVDRIVYGRDLGTPQAHVDRISRFLGRQTAQPEPPAGRRHAEYETEPGAGVAYSSPAGPGRGAERQPVL
jgi:hypothetical protein